MRTKTPIQSADMTRNYFAPDADAWTQCKYYLLEMGGEVWVTLGHTDGLLQHEHPYLDSDDRMWLVYLLAKSLIAIGALEFCRYPEIDRRDEDEWPDQTEISADEALSEFRAALRNDSIRKTILREIGVAPRAGFEIP